MSLSTITAHNMANKSSNQSDPHATSDAGKANDTQRVRERDEIRGSFGVSNSKTKEADTTATNQAVDLQDPLQVVGPPTASSVSDIHSVADKPVTSSPRFEKPLPAPAETKKTSNIFLENLAAPVKKT
ncbi:hypothetical protein BGZ91_011889, partial [Linnemannia elongata]